MFSVLQFMSRAGIASYPGNPASYVARFLRIYIFTRGAKLARVPVLPTKISPAHGQPDWRLQTIGHKDAIT